jgi:CheY-like chemotaxis protein
MFFCSTRWGDDFAKQQALAMVNNFEDSLRWAEIMHEKAGHPRFYCPPSNLAMSADQAMDWSFWLTTPSAEMIGARAERNRCSRVHLIGRETARGRFLVGEPVAMRRLGRIPLDRMKFPLTLAGGLRTAFADFVSTPLPRHLADLMCQLHEERDNRFGRDIAMIFADVRLRGVMDGIDLAREVKMRWPLLPVILTSGHPRERVGKLPPGVAYLPKPWQPLNVLIAAEQALASGRAN